MPLFRHAVAATAFALVAGWPQARAAQDAAARATPQRPTFRSGVATVRVDVSVTGRKGAVVDGLSAADFILEEDGVAQTIDTCQFIALTGERLTDREESLEIRSPEHAEAEAARDDVRLFALFLDDYHIDKLPQITLPLRRGLTEFIDLLGPNDLIATADPLTPMSALELTRDRFDLKETVRKFEGRQGELFPVRSALEEAQLESRNWRRLRAEVTLSALAGLVVKMGSLREGRKSIVFVSQGPPTFFGRLDGDIDHRMQDVFEAANRGNVTIHVVDPRGLGTEGRGGSRDTLYRLAAETGGRAIVNTNNFVNGLHDVVADASAYYLLGYTPMRTAPDGKFRKIKVDVRRPGVEVLARKGYWAPTAAESVAADTAASRPEVPGVVGALAGLALSKTPRAIDTWIGLEDPGGAATVAVTWDRRTRALDLREVVAVEVEALPVEDGPPMAPAQTIVRSDAPEGQAVARVPWPAEGGRLRLTARDEGGEVVDRWIERVPGKAEPLLSFDDIRFYRALTPLALRALRDAARPVPTAARSFRRTDRVLVDLVARPADGVELELELLNSTGERLLAFPVAPAVADAATRARVEVPVASLGLGRYVLRARGRRGEVQAERLAAFDVVR